MDLSIDVVNRITTNDQICYKCNGLIPMGARVIQILFVNRMTNNIFSQTTYLCNKCENDNLMFMEESSMESFADRLSEF